MNPVVGGLLVLASLAALVGGLTVALWGCAMPLCLKIAATGGISLLILLSEVFE